MPCFLFALLLILFQPVDSPGVIEWNPYYTLRWEDFRGKPTPESAGDAGAVVQIKAKPYVVKKELHYEVFAFFNRNKSWSRERSDALLAHEQIHFDIAELYARKIRKMIHESGKMNPRDISRYNDAIQDLLEESNEFDRRYDAETLHGALSAKQEIWASRVKNELRSLSRFSKPRRVIQAGRR